MVRHVVIGNIGDGVGSCELMNQLVKTIGRIFTLGRSGSASIGRDVVLLLLADEKRVLLV